MGLMVSMFLIIFPLFFTLTYLLNFLKPRELPIIGNLHQLGSLPHRSFRALTEKYGPLMLLHLGAIPTLVVSSAEAAKDILKTDQDVKFSGRPQLRIADVFAYGFTDIAFSPYGEYWRQVRKMCVHDLLSQRRVREFHFIRQEEVEKLINKNRVSCEEGVAVNLGEMLLTVANNIVSRSALGRIFEKDSNDDSLGVMARKTIELLGAFCFKDLFPYMGWMDYLTGLAVRMRNIAKVLGDALDQVIEEYQDSFNDDKSNNKDIVDILLSLQKSGVPGMNLTRDNLKAINGM